MVKHIQIVGGPGSGKSTLAKKIARKFSLGYIELDALYWKPNWTGTELDEYIKNIQNAMDANASGWVIDGSYTGLVGNFIQPKLDVLVYLQIPPYISIPRALRRSFVRIFKGELLWGTNKESVKDSLKLAWWTIKSYSSRVNRMHAIQESKPNFEMHIFKSNKAADRWLDSL